MSRIRGKYEWEQNGNDMANKKRELGKSPTTFETEDFLKQCRDFREKACVYSLKWPTRSGARYTLDAMIAGIDEVGLVMTGNERLFKGNSHNLMCNKRR